MREKAWSRRLPWLFILLVYALLAGLTYFLALRGSPTVVLAWEYLLTAAALGVAGWRARSRARAGKAPAGSVLWLFAAIMALRLGVFWRTGQIWGKAPMLVLTFLVAFGCQGWSWEDLGLGWRGLKRELAWGLAACFWVWSLVVVSYLLQAWWFVGAFRVNWTWSGVSFPALVGLILRFLQGNFAEEVFFRGYTQRQWEIAWGPRALWGQALLFGLFHVNYHLFPLQLGSLVWYVLFSGAFGLAMGVVRYQSGSLFPVALAHPFYNLTIACGLAVPTIVWQANPWVSLAGVRVGGLLIQLALFWWVLPVLLRGTAKLLSPAGSPGADLPSPGFSVR